ncbi:RNA-binding region-containing protein 3 [Achroia grisella]|uniref:RNA-binding region-containing protein 3 n=1 Tax=Achroia grisella TaxID=688607 RepID=UPI0027D26215|nr:RNA-binding region-containing protein 3 [Achroia grisella]
MSNVLLIRHLPNFLSFQDKEQLLKHFGAEKVWETSAKRNYIFASFSSAEKAKASLIRLHQLKIAQRRLVVEYSFEKELIKNDNQEIETSASTKHLKDFLRLLNAWNPSVDFYQPPPVHLRYKYPDASTTTLINILYAICKHKPFYIQVLHLMNRMCLDTPFKDNERAIEFFKETFQEYLVSEVSVIPPLPVSEPESEISSDEVEKQQQSIPKSVKRRQQTLPKTRKRVAAILSTATLPKAKRVHINQEEVFENITPIQEAKKISLVVHQDALQKPSEEPEVIGELGKFEKEEQPTHTPEAVMEPEQPTITKKELLRNRLSYRDMKVLPIFKNYHPGQPSMRLYIKNLAKTVTELDVKRIYKRYVEDLTDEEQLCFDVRVMQEGKMKGQAFVTFPSVSTAEKALNETNGYMLKDKPMVVQFARAANKKSIE